EEERLGTLKSGKEAEVFLVERRSATGSCLLAEKRYRPRHPGKGELREEGFSKGTIYHNDSVYRTGWHLKARDARAVAKSTRHGEEVLARMWPQNELEMLRRAWQAGVSVPYPVDLTDDGLLMEYIGDASQAAPRLVAARLSRDELAGAWRQLVDNLVRLARARVVHADLSVYNLLWWQGRLIVIDFPQAVDAVTNATALDLLHRDVVNVATWFGRHGVTADAERVFGRLVSELYRAG
ncbi:MAG TPA: RIO1 family regulatory kinase/ATPase, partial [Candidatus Limnocylindrales bacterium]